MATKILLWLDVISAHFGMAKWLQEKHDCEISAIIDVNNGKKFYEEQQIVKFHSKWYLRECFDNSQKKPDLKYLAEIEKKYKFDIWKIVYSDVNFYKYNDYYKFNYDEILTIIEQECRFFEKVIDIEKPNYLAIRITDLSNGQILQKICEAKNIKVLMLSHTRFENRSYISNEYDYLEFTKKHMEKKQKSFEEMREVIKIVKDSQAKFNKRYRGTRNSWFFGSLKYLSIIAQNKYKKYYANFGKSFFKVIFIEGTRPLRAIYRKKFIDANLLTKINYKQKFIYFPLHLEPERTMLIPTPFYSNQLEIITNIAKSLPIDFQLIVKEHPMQKIYGWRDISYYKKILSLPNVEMIHPSLSQTPILENCKMVIVITGTTGLEAALYKKPSIVFGDTIYDSLPSVQRITNLEKLPVVIKETLNKEVNLEDVNEFMYLLDTNTFDFPSANLSLKFIDEFFYDGYLFDTEINNEQAEKFIKKNSEYFETLAEEHIKKIKELEQENK